MMSDTITRQLDALLAISKTEKGEVSLMRGLRGAVWIMVNHKIVTIRVWERLWELGDLEHITYDRGKDHLPIHRLRITEQGLQRLWDSGEEALIEEIN